MWEIIGIEKPCSLIGGVTMKFHPAIRTFSSTPDDVLITGILYILS